VRHGKPRIELEGTAEGLLGAYVGIPILGVVDVLADHAVATTQLCPGRSEARIQLQAASIEIAGLRELIVTAGQLVRPEVELIGACVVRRIGRGRGAATGQRQSEGLHHPPGDVVLQSEQIAQRRQDRMRREQRPTRGLDELRGGSQLVAGAEERPHHHTIDIGLGREGFEVRCFASETSDRGCGTHDQRAESRKRRGDGIRQAEGEEVRIRIGAQDTEWQHHEASERASQGRRFIAKGATHGA